MEGANAHCGAHFKFDFQRTQANAGDCKTRRLAACVKVREHRQAAAIGADMRGQPKGSHRTRYRKDVAYQRRLRRPSDRFPQPPRPCRSLTTSSNKVAPTTALMIALSL